MPEARAKLFLALGPKIDYLTSFKSSRRVFNDCLNYDQIIKHAKAPARYDAAGTASPAAGGVY